MCCSFPQMPGTLKPHRFATKDPRQAGSLQALPFKKRSDSSMKGEFLSPDLGDLALIPVWGLKFCQALPNSSSSTCRLCLLSPVF